MAICYLGVSAFWGVHHLCKFIATCVTMQIIRYAKTIRETVIVFWHQPGVLDAHNVLNDFKTRSSNI